MCVAIEKLRMGIDEIDDALLRLLNQRARLVLELGASKKRRGIPVRDRIREHQVLTRVRENNCGPLDDSSAVKIFQLIIRKSRSLQQQTSRQTPESPLEAPAKTISCETQPTNNEVVSQQSQRQMGAYLDTNGKVGAKMARS